MGKTACHFSECIDPRSMGEPRLHAAQFGPSFGGAHARPLSCHDSTEQENDAGAGHARQQGAAGQEITPGDQERDFEHKRLGGAAQLPDILRCFR
ncbi:hypothetical protein D3C72_1860810 [compost metagenome]